MTGADPIEHHLHETLERLTDEFAGMHGSETVARYASEVAAACDCGPPTEPS